MKIQEFIQLNKTNPQVYSAAVRKVIYSGFQKPVTRVFTTSRMDLGGTVWYPSDGDLFFDDKWPSDKDADDWIPVSEDAVLALWPKSQHAQHIREVRYWTSAVS